MATEETVSLETLEGGAVMERFNIALAAVLKNVNDVNTDWKTAREIRLKFTVKPDENREVLTVKISSETKLAPVAPLSTHMFLGKRGGELVACVRSTRQGNLLADNPFPNNVAPINSARKEAAND